MKFRNALRVLLAGLVVASNNTQQVYAQITSVFDPTFEYFAIPEQKWSVQIPFTMGPPFEVGSGNAVTASPDGSSVYVTLSNGRLEVLSAIDGSRRGGYEPAPLFSGWTTTCSTGVSFGGEGDVSNRFVLHTEIHSPPFGSSEDVQSRIVAFSDPSLEPLWTTTVPGEVQGKPIVSLEYIFFTHNQHVTSEEPVGSFSMMIAETGVIIFTEVAGDSSSDPDPNSLTFLNTLRLPYGPLGFAPAPVFGRYPGGQTNFQPLFVWSTNVDDGRGSSGYTRAFQLPRLFNALVADQLSTVFLQVNRWNAAASPTLSNDGLFLLFGMRSNSIRAWTDDAPFGTFNRLPNIVQMLDADPFIFQRAIPYSPVFSPSELSFFVSTTGGTLYSLSTATGETLWSIPMASPISSEVKVSVDGALVYFTTESGMVAAVQQDTGMVAWSITCAEIINQAGTFCIDEIFSESSLSPGGSVLYYSDIFGNVKALTLGEADPPVTEQPTVTASVAPSATPSSASSGDQQAQCAALFATCATSSDCCESLCFLGRCRGGSRSRGKATVKIGGTRGGRAGAIGLGGRRGIRGL